MALKAVPNPRLQNWLEIGSMLNLKVPRSDFLVKIPSNFERLEHHNYQSNRKWNASGVREKDESLKYRVHFTGICVTIATK